MALSWRLALRDVLQMSFGHGYSVVDFIVSQGHYFYVLAASVPWFLYVVECSDASLYTGITPDVNRRVKLHNLGSGAAYTAVRRPVKLVGLWLFQNRQAALKAEYAFKQQSRQAKLGVLASRSAYLGSPFILED